MSGFHGICISEKKNIYLKDFFFKKKFLKQHFFSYKNGGYLWLLHFFSLLYNDFFKFLIKLLNLNEHKNTFSNYYLQQSKFYKNY